MVVHPYRAIDEDELSLTKGEIITILSKETVDKGWWRGDIDGRVGIFPENFVKIINKDFETETDTQEQCVVVHPYQASDQDELSLTKGEIITILSKNTADKGWWKGDIDGRVGIFPDNFVKIINTDMRWATI